MILGLSDRCEMSLVVFEVRSGWEGSGRFQLSLRLVWVGPGRVLVVFQVRPGRVGFWLSLRLGRIGLSLRLGQAGFWLSLELGGVGFWLSLKLVWDRSG